jgi:glutaredoxin
MVSPGSDGPGGAPEHVVVLYGLSTCVWCKKTREFLESEGVAFDIVYVDKLEGPEQETALGEVRRWNPSGSFPTVVIDGARSVNGYKPDDLKEVLGL